MMSGLSLGRVSTAPAGLALVFLLLILASCERPSGTPDSAKLETGQHQSRSVESPPTPTLANTATLPSIRSAASTSSTPTVTFTPGPTSAPTEQSAPLPSATPFFSEGPSAVCGQLLPILPSADYALNRAVNWDSTALARLEAAVPNSAKPALDRILSAPATVGLAAYRFGQEEEGAYLNADAPMPLASVVKVIHLVAFVEAVAAGQLDLNETISLDEVDAFYLPGLDLGSHSRAISELEQEARVFGDSPSVRLEEVPWMMIRHSSNAAMDYLHMRLGQLAIEKTAISLGLVTQTAPCPFLGQFLAMSNHTRPRSADRSAVEAYIESPETYGREAMLLTDAFSGDASFRRAELERRRRPSLATQHLFSENLNPQGSTREYATLMVRIAVNNLSDAESSFLARRYLEWPMRFEANQELFSNLGFKNGAMPGILTLVYYAYPSGETTPVTVALFFRDLPNRTYQQWRRESLAHDELARWLLSESEAIPLLRAVLSGE